MTSIEQIALETGCSQTTVRRVLRGGNKEVWSGAAERAAQIRKAARELGFLPNASAAAMKNGRFNSVLLVLSAERGRSYLPELLLHSLCSALEEAEQHLTIGRFTDEALTSSESLPTFLRRWSCDGALVNYTDRFPSHINDLLRQYRIPLIWMNAPFDADCVKYDELRGGRDAAKLLLENGHKKIAYVDLRHKSGDEPHYSTPLRRAGFQRAMAKAGLASASAPAQSLELGDLPGAEQIARLTEWLRSGERPTGIVTYDRAERILLAAAAAGLRVPEDLSLVTFGDGHSEYAGVSVTHMALPYEEAGRTAVSMLLEKIEHADQSMQIKPLALTVFQGETCTRPLGRALHK
jgi:Transcriptional regulators